VVLEQRQVACGVGAHCGGRVRRVAHLVRVRARARARARVKVRVRVRVRV